jgi:hypothetical protein
MADALQDGACGHAPEERREAEVHPERSCALELGRQRGRREERAQQRQRRPGAPQSGGSRAAEDRRRLAQLSGSS